MNCSWVAELEQKQIFLPFYIPFKFFCLGLPAIHVYEIILYLPTVLPCSRCDSHVSIPNLELAATGSPGKLLHSTAQESQCHSISVPVWTAARYACLDIPIMVIIILCWCFTTIILNSFSYISTSPFENVWRITSPKWITNEICGISICLSLIFDQTMMTQELKQNETKLPKIAWPSPFKSGFPIKHINIYIPIKCFV